VPERLILLSNDDGIQAEGLLALEESVASLGEVYVVAPDREKSAAGHSVTLHHPLRVQKLDERHYAVDGTPTDSVILGVRELLPRRPNIVISGINRGPNMGDDVTYSGTVAAALEGTLLGIPSFAISVAEYDNIRYDGAARFAARLANLIFENGLPSDTMLNVNVPNLPEESIKGVAVTRQGKRVYKDEIIAKSDPRGRVYYWIGGADSGWEPESETDFAAFEEDRISITPLHLDLTKFSFLDELRGWDFKV